MIARPNNLSSLTTPLFPNQSLLIPIDCSCNHINDTFGNISFAPLNYTIVLGDTFFKVSTENYQNLVTYQSVQVVNPAVIPTLLQVGDLITFPIFCKCPTSDQLKENVSFLITYVFQPSDTINSIALKLGSDEKSIIDFNGNNLKPYDTVFVPVSKIPLFSQPRTQLFPPATAAGDRRKKEVVGLAIGLGICGALLILVSGFWIRSQGLRKKNRVEARDLEKRSERGKMSRMMSEKNILSDVAEYLDKYKVYGIDELRKATDDFDEKLVIEEGSVYKGSIDGEVVAIKKMGWNASEELKILQKVNHGNLVKLDGFCIDTEEANCYLVYEYIENGSLHSWLHGKKKGRLNWKTRLRVAIDVANGLQYIHEHTTPRVVHKDIKSSNILLDTNMRAKIANFGLAKSGCNAITMHIVGTQGYIAPEYLNDGLVSTKMDVFSFGVVLLELVSGKEAIDEEGKVLWGKVGGILEGKEEQKLKRLKGWMDEYLLGETLSMGSVMNVMNLAIACLNKDPSRRPSMVDVVYALCKSDDLFFDLSEDGLSPRPQVVAR